MPSNLRSIGRNYSKSLRLVRATNHSAPPARSRLRRKEWRIQFMKEITIARTITGVEQ